MAISLKFRHVKDLFCILYRELNEEICKIKSSPNVFVFADKTDNLNKLSKDHHKELLLDNLAKTYQEAPPKLEASINLEAKSISTKLKISDRTTHCQNTFVRDTQRLQRQLSFQSNVLFNKSIKKRTWKSE